jgi:secreted trypsin-like serine protease
MGASRIAQLICGACRRAESERCLGVSDALCELVLDRPDGPAACGGDSGGPLVIDGRPAGVSGQILSRNGLVCRTAYSGYTRTDIYADFIRAEIRGS